MVPFILYYSKSSKTVKCKKIPEGSHAHDLLKYSSATLGSGNIKMAVQLPDGEDINEWIAVNSKSRQPYVNLVETRAAA